MKGAPDPRWPKEIVYPYRPPWMKGIVMLGAFPPSSEWFWYSAIIWGRPFPPKQEVAS